MQKSSRSHAVALQSGTASLHHRLIPWAMVVLIGGALWVGAARAQDPEIITSHGISTFGDLKYPADFKHLVYVNPDAPKGGEISVAALGGFDSMNPYTVKGRAAGLSSGFYESILSGTADEVGAAYCLLCETMTYPRDRSWVTFALRPNITFSDGSALTTEDVLFSYNLFLTKGLQDFRFVLAQQVEKVEVLSPTEIRFIFKAGFPTRDLPETVGGLPVMSRAHYEANQRDLEASSLEPFLGSAAYVLDKLDVGQSISYKLNPDYWGRDLPINAGRNNFERIRIEYYADSNAALEGFKAGNYTFRNENSSKNWATAYDFPAVTSGAVLKAELPNGNLAPGQSWVFNLRRPQFQDARVREAISDRLHALYAFTLATEFVVVHHLGQIKYARIQRFFPVLIEEESRISQTCSQYALVAADHQARICRADVGHDKESVGELAGGIQQRKIFLVGLHGQNQAFLRNFEECSIKFSDQHIGAFNQCCHFIQ